MAKLARLMSSDLSQSIEPARLAENHESLNGELEPEAMPRLRALISKPGGSISFNLTFSRDDADRIIIGGHLDASLFLRCQRCLETMEVGFSNSIHLAWVGSEQEARELPDDLEPWLAEGPQTNVRDIIEDQVLLGLPMAPAHDPGNCPATEQLQSWQEQRENPFAVLRQLKTDKH